MSSRAALGIIGVLLVVAAALCLFLVNRPVTTEKEARRGKESLEVLRPESGGELVRIPGGTFTMGDADGRADESPHEVLVGPVYIDKYPVTQELYEEVTGVEPSKWKSKKNPVEQIQWTDAATFCNRCSEIDGLTPCYDPDTWECNFDADGYRLPTEAEWEYACRAGSETKYFFGNAASKLPRYAWFKPGSAGKPRPVGRKQPNRWGLYDMNGNVWEWCNDFYKQDYYEESPRENPRGPAAGKMRVLRGGAWDCNAKQCTSAYRFKEFPTYGDVCFGYDSYGFRRLRSGEAGKKATVGEPARAEEQAAPAQVAAPAVVREIPAPAPPPGVPTGTGGGTSKTIVFVSDRSGSLDIWTMSADGTGQKPLTNDAHPDADPRFSPDGKRVIYTSLRGGFPEVWVMNTDGSDQKRVAEGCQADWSPDGKAIVFIRDKQAYVRELASGKEKRVTPEDWERCGVPAWRPGGKHFAVASRHLGKINIFILSFDGKENYPLKTEEPSCTPRWSRDGNRLLCQTVRGHVCQVEVDGKNWEQVVFGADLQHDAAYSPDGSMFVFCRAPTPQGPWQICVKKFDSDDFDFIQLTTEGSNSLPDWH